MECLKRAVSFGAEPEQLKFSDTWCMDLPCFKNCPILEQDQKEQEQLEKGEYFADYDEETESYCVFHTDFKTGHAFSSYTSPEQAEKDAEERNNK